MENNGLNIENVAAMHVKANTTLGTTAVGKRGFLGE